MSKDLEVIKQQLRIFAKERDWDQFHSPKNFSMALIVECAELVEHFQWLTDDQSKNLPADTLDEVSLEMADIMIYLIRLADKLDVDLLQAVERKIGLNAIKYPIEKSKGIAAKYSQLPLS
jgi:NTP pyrophosphatase (non-canonical NTP hydrolase)